VKTPIYIYDVRSHGLHDEPFIWFAGHPAAKTPCLLFCATICGFTYFILFPFCL